jgi:hypothetical protein
MNEQCYDIHKQIISFIMPEDSYGVLYLTNDIFLLSLTSKYWNKIINDYIDEYKKIHTIEETKFINMTAEASKYGYINVLEWFKNSKRFFQYTYYALECCSEYGHTHILNWWLTQSGFEIKFEKNCILLAVTNGHINVLEWWVNNYPRAFHAIITAQDIVLSCIQEGHLDVLEWMKNNTSGFGIYFNFDMSLSHKASFHGHVHILEWLNNNNYRFKNSMDACIILASRGGSTNVLEWLKNLCENTIDTSFLYEGLNRRKYEFICNTHAIKDAGSNGYINVLEWWKNSGYKLKYNEDMIDAVSSKGYIDILEWWKNLCKNSDYKFKYTKEAINKASLYGRIYVLEWWKNSGYELRYQMFNFKDLPAKSVEWWKNSGLEYDGYMVHYNGHFDY